MKNSWIYLFAHHISGSGILNRVRGDYGVECHFQQYFSYIINGQYEQHRSLFTVKVESINVRESNVTLMRHNYIKKCKIWKFCPKKKGSKLLKYNFEASI